MTATLTPEQHLSRTVRMRTGAYTSADLDYLRIRANDAETRERIASAALVAAEAIPTLVCDCRCSCHAGSCSRVIDLETLDCVSSCRASHILASECNLDETRPAAHV